ncbi:glycosyltransferase [Chrysosporum ovalisporum APH033B]|uniref:glycosyltransferase n=1 Tax=Umezakia ovalisporum TaxID=75695 RepID=UPI0024737696|nr:glycosyltransferase [Umezakia ovalisporum]MDH6066719.1 glycosyltransferase [Umezakia ovalisporum APH033B]
MKIKIVFFIETGAFGGCEKHLLQLIQCLDNNEFENHLVVAVNTNSHKVEPLIQEINNLIAYGYLKNCRYINSSQGFRRFKPLVEVLETLLEPGIFHFYKGAIDSCTAPLFIARFLRKVSVQTIQSNLDFFNNSSAFRRHIIRPFCLNASQTVIAVSDAVKSDCIKYYKSPVNRTIAIPNGIKVKNFPDAGDLSADDHRTTVQEKLSHELGIDLRSKITFLKLARLSGQKGHIYLIEALDKLQKNYPDIAEKAIFLFAGAGELENSLKAKVQENNLEHLVKFLGFRSDIKQLLLGCDAMVLTSLFEGLPLVVLEAMAMSKPVIATSVDGTPEAVVDGETGLLMEPQNPDAILEALLKFMDLSVEQRLEMGEKGRQRVIDKFDLDKQVKQVEDIYRKLSIQVSSIEPSQSH